MDLCVRAETKLEESGRRCQNFLFVSVVRHVTGWCLTVGCLIDSADQHDDTQPAGWFRCFFVFFGGSGSCPTHLSVVFVWTNGLLMNVFLCPTLFVEWALVHFIWIYLIYLFFFFFAIPHLLLNFQLRLLTKVCGTTKINHLPEGLYVGCN